MVTTLAKDPRSKVFIPLADEYVKAGKWQKAAAVLEDGLKVCPGFITAMVALGRAYDQLGQADKAKAILEEAVRLSPDNLRAHRTLAKLYRAEGAWDCAEQSCRVILAASPHDEEALHIIRVLAKPVSPATPNQALDPSPSTAAVPRTVQVEEVETKTDPSSAQLAEQSGKAARLEQWLKKIQSRRQATASRDPGEYRS